jgi:hypothetical protein
MATEEDLMLIQAGLGRIIGKEQVENEDVIRLSDYLMRILDSKRYWCEALRASRTELDTAYAEQKLEKISIVQRSLIHIVEEKVRPSPASTLSSFTDSIELAIRELKILDENYKSYAFKLLIG